MNKSKQQQLAKNSEVVCVCVYIYICIYIYVGGGTGSTLLLHVKVNITSQTADHGTNDCLIVMK